MNIVRPSADQVSKYLKQWDSNDAYTLPDKSLKKLFTETYPYNTNIEEVLIKICSLNNLYRTNILSPLPVAKRIIYLCIDKRLKKKCKSLVEDIAKVQFSNKKSRRFYSFSTKYCNHHFPNDYPIYDSFVEKSLKHFRDKDKFSNFKNVDLKDYSKYCDILDKFKEYYGLEKINAKKIDQYLWQVGKQITGIKKQYPR